MENVVVLDHPLIQHKVSLLRDRNTRTKEFRELVLEISMLMGYEVTRQMPLKEVEIETPGSGKDKSFIRQEIRNCAYIKSRAWNGRWTLKTFTHG